MNAESDAVSGNKPRPFVKWAGGKRQLLKDLIQRMPKAGRYKCMNYFEIFGGGGGGGVNFFDRQR